MRFIFVLILGLAPFIGRAEILTSVTLGDGSSEFTSAVKSTQAAIITSADTALGEPGRRLVPATPDDTASITFTAKVSPTEQTYITLRVWGGETTWGPVHLVLADASNLNLGSLWWHITTESPFPGRFIYRTLPIPIEVTLGKSTIDLRLQTTPSSENPGSVLLGYVPPPKSPNRPSFALYNVYTHTSPWFLPPHSEQQGAPFAWGEPVAKPVIYPETIEQRLVQRALADIGFTLNANVERSQSGPGHRRDLTLLAACGLIYNTPWSGHYQDATIPVRVRNAIDINVQRQASQGGDPGILFQQGWESHGQIALAYSRLHDVFAAKRWLNENITLNYPGRPVTLTRRQAYANFFHDAFEWRRTDRGNDTARSLRIARSLYRMQQALRLLGDPRALTEPQSLRYVHEAAGLAPLRTREFGIAAADANFPAYSVTGAGLPRESGNADTNGEFTRILVRLVEETGDPLVKTQAQKALAACSVFRIPANSPEGNRVLCGVGTLSWNAPAYPSAITYNGIEEAAVLEDPVSLRLAQLEIEHGRPYLLGPTPARDANWDPSDTLRLVDYYRKIKDLPPSPHRLPMEPDSPDSVWADEELGVFAFHHGDTRVYGSFFNNDLAAGRAIGDLGVIEFIRPDMDRLVDFRPESSTPRSGLSLKLKQPYGERTYTQTPLPPGYTAWQESPPDAVDPRAGLAYFYRLHYGDYLVGMNTTQPGTYRESTYMLAFPEGVTAATDIATGQPVNPKKPVRLGPGETRVLHLQR
ncbi:MAG: hypothetical protein ACAH89_02285 [Rariglobus sp.]